MDGTAGWIEEQQVDRVESSKRVGGGGVDPEEEEEDE